MREKYGELGGALSKKNQGNVSMKGHKTQNLPHPLKTHFLAAAAHSSPIMVSQPLPQVICIFLSEVSKLGPLPVPADRLRMQMRHLLALT